MSNAGDLHWKQVSFNMNSNLQVIAKMKSKHMAGTFTKKKKCIVTGVYSDVQAWPGREKEDLIEKRAYFGIKTAERIIEFECESKRDKQFWLDGIQYMLNCRAKAA
ncbi:VAN3-binding protein-like isoform X1 [Arachis ipaensis]|uniref:VAN3-binding protein-like isoform X1 n=2 Tax=Arachis ipaensis TaxID=130454 RepID=UPI0007AF9AFD|nr:VAN3-binding protein-like isoform X1 [Arachis ipaensis]